MSDLGIPRHQALLGFRQLAAPMGPAAAAHAMGRGRLRRGEDPEIGEITGWAQACPPVGGPASFTGSGSPGRPADDRAEGNGRSRRDGFHCITCGRRLVPSAGDGSSLACPDRSQLPDRTAGHRRDGRLPAQASSGQPGAASRAPCLLVGVCPPGKGGQS